MKVGWSEMIQMSYVRLSKIFLYILKPPSSYGSRVEEHHTILYSLDTYPTVLIHRKNTRAKTNKLNQKQNTIANKENNHT